MSTETMGSRTFALTICLLLAAGSPASAVDNPIAGKKLVVRSTPKFVLQSKDANIGSPISICNGVPTELPFVTLTIDDGVNAEVFNLPCGNWRSNAAMTVWTYRNKQAPAGPSAVKSVKLKDGLLKIVGQGLGSIPVPSSSATIDVVLNIHGIADRYCMSFSGAGDGSKFVVKDAPAASCAPPACAATTGGFCWFIGDYGQNCNSVCANAGLVYDAATASFAGDGGTDANCLAVVSDLGVSVGAVSAETCFGGAGCIVRPAPAAPARCEDPPTTASGADPGFRACACQ